MNDKTFITCDSRIEVIAVEQSWPGSWGRADSVKTAIQKAISSGAKRKNGFAIYAVPKGTQIDSFGRFTWSIDEAKEGPLDDVLNLGTV